MSALPATERTTLPDGSVFEVDWHSSTGCIISRYVDGECVWGQAFGGDSVHASIARVRASMTDHPGTYLSASRRGIYGLDGRVSSLPKEEG